MNALCRAFEMRSFNLTVACKTARESIPKYSVPDKQIERGKMNQTLKVGVYVLGEKKIAFEELQ